MTPGGSRSQHGAGAGELIGQALADAVEAALLEPSRCWLEHRTREPWLGDAPAIIAAIIQGNTRTSWGPARVPYLWADYWGDSMAEDAA